jgi:intein-encoded DNA endonuclease-like protein
MIEMKEIDVRKLPIGLRLKIYEYALFLNKKGLKSSEIRMEVLKKWNLLIRKKTIYRWITNRHKACRQLRIFTPTPSKELSYIIGVLFGDGTLKNERKNYQYKFILRTKDRDFAEYFSNQISKLLNFPGGYKIRTENGFLRKGGKGYVVSVSNKMLFHFLSKDAEYLMNYVKEYPADFIRGLFDSDGFTIISCGKNFRVGFGIVNTNIKILEFVKNLLRDNFGITSKIYTTIKKGHKVKIWGKIYTANKTVYRLVSSGLNNAKKFLRFISSSIRRKREKLEDAIYIIENFPTNFRVLEWLKIYKKEGREWIRIAG